VSGRLDKDAVRRANAVERIIPELLGEHAIEVGRELKVRCPWHQDKKPSLRINASKGVWRCDPCGVGGDVFAFVERYQNVEFELALAFLAARAGVEASPEKREAATYAYEDETGALLFQVVRFEPKDFRQRRPDGAGGFVWNLNGTRRVAYRLPELKGREGVLVVEGEKDADRAWSLGLPATCNAGGAGRWTDELTRQLVTAGVLRVVVIPDRDEPGRAHAALVADSCHRAGLQVRVVELPNVPEKGDLSDYLETHTKADLLALIRAAPTYEPPSTPIQPASVVLLSARGSGDGRLQLTALSDLLAEPEEPLAYLVRDRIAVGSLNLLAGKPKAGKSTAARALALEVARGGVWLGSACEARPVWYLALEDKRSEVRSHFKRMGASAEPLRFVFPQGGADLMAQLHVLAAREHPGLIIVDTLQRLIGARDLNDYAEVTTKLTPVLALARETGAAVLLVHHAGKGERTGIDAVLGSTALAASVDNVFLLTRTDRHRVLSSVQRIGPDLAEMVVSLNETTGHVEAGPSRHDADRSSIEGAILVVLDGADRALTEAEIEPAIEGRTSLKREALRALVAAGRVTREGKGGKGDPFRYRRPDSRQADGGTGPQDSCSLVPAYMLEHENTNAISVKNPDKYGPDSCSRDLASSEQQSISREQESDARVRVRL
jgi:hypothetical protein